MAAIDGSVAESGAHDALMWTGIFAETVSVALKDLEF